MPRAVGALRLRPPRGLGGLARRFGVGTLSFGILLGAWWLVAELEIWPELFVPRPAAVWDRFVESITVHDGRKGLSGYYLWEHVWASLWRLLRGVGLAIVAGVAIGVLLASLRPVRMIVEPWVTFVRSLPPLAYFSLLIIWFGIEDASKVWLLFLAAFPPIALSVLGAIETIPADRINGARALGAGRWRVIRHVVLPSALPELFTGIRLALGFAWTTIVAAETVDGIPGIGGLAWSTKKFQQTDVAVLSIVVIGLTAIATDLVVTAVERRVVPWKGRA
ncbi:MAG: ABC transporter permease [Thermoleophilia bacterium]